VDNLIDGKLSLHRYERYLQLAAWNRDALNFERPKRGIRGASEIMRRHLIT
jgi:hypothetical protein